MARACTTADVFNAIAEERRREILRVLAECGEQVVGALVKRLGMTQPTVSKHLAVLRRVGLVGVQRRGRERVYSLHAEALQPVHAWAQSFEELWAHKNNRIKARAERAAAARWGVLPPPTPPTSSKET